MEFSRGDTMCDKNNKFIKGYVWKQSINRNYTLKRNKEYYDIVTIKKTDCILCRIVLFEKRLKFLT